MAKFNGFILTEKGRELLAKGLAGETITFTKMATGDGTSLTSERERTALVNQITTLPILNINVKRNGTCEINALLTNKSVTTGFYIKELGIFAHGNDNVEILYAYNISTSPDFVPPFSANNVVEIEYVDTIIVDQVTNVTAVIDPSITYITKKYADENYLEGSRLGEILGLEFGGNIQDSGSKIKGKFYYDSVTKFYYECLENTNLTYNDSGKFRAISNKPILDKLENCVKKTDLASENEAGVVTLSKIREIAPKVDLTAIQSKVDEAWGKANDAQVYRIYEIRLAGMVYGLIFQKDEAGERNGYVVTGIENFNADRIIDRVSLRALQFFRNGQWINAYFA